MNRVKLGLAATLVIVFSTWLFAAGTDDCQKAIRDQVYKNNPKAEKVVFQPDTEKHEEKTDIQTIYRGEGEFLRHTGKWEKFTWECSYNPKKQNVINAFYTVKEDVHPEAGTPVSELKDLVGARAAGSEGEVEKRGYKFVKTTKGSDSSHGGWKVQIDRLRNPGRLQMKASA
jgi:hypothetical protein